MVTKVIGDWNEFIAALIVEGANKLQIGNVLMQWGIASAGGGNLSVTFGTAYTSTPTVGGHGFNTASLATSGNTNWLGAVSTTGFQIRHRAWDDAHDWLNNTGNIHWFAIGINNA